MTRIIAGELRGRALKVPDAGTRPTAERVREAVFSSLTSLDAIAVHFHKTHRQTYRKKYPATDFSNGITNLTKISASERLGLVFLFVILAQYDEGWAILNTALLASTKPISNKC